MDIRIENLKVVYRDAGGRPLPVLDIASWAVEAGRQVCLVGGSGSGKTTLLNALAGIIVPTEGRVLYDGRDITRLPEAARDRFRAEHVGYVFQTFNLLQGLSALENVALAATFGGHAGHEARSLGRQLLERVGLGHRLDARPRTLSVGEQQRVAIARAVVNDPTVVLADEPTANLDVKNGDEVLELLKDVAGETHTILLLVTHEPRVQEHFDQVVPLAEIMR